MLKSKYVLTGIMVVFLSLQSLLFTNNDIYTGFFVIITAVIMYRVVFDIQASNKKAMRVNTKAGGVLYTFLSKERTLFSRGFSFSISLFMSFMLVLTLKGLVNSYTAIFFYPIITVLSLFIFSYVNENSGKNKKIKNELASDLENHASKVLHIIFIAFLLNVFLSSVISGFDTNHYLSDYVTFSNFDEKIASSPHIVQYNGTNRTTMIFMNLYIVMEKFKLATSTQLLSMIGITQADKASYYLVIYGFIFFFNIFKMFAFSMSFVFLQKGFERLATDMTPRVQKVFDAGIVLKTKHGKSFFKTGQNASKKVRAVAIGIKGSILTKIDSRDKTASESAENFADTTLITHKNDKE